MKKYILVLFAGLVIFGFVLAPNLSFAQVGDVDPDPLVSECVSITNNLRYRDRDANKNGEVSTLQDFLQSKGYLNSEPTGYFGLLTFKAVKDFQKANGISPTGYVGPITRAKIASLTGCDGIIITPPNPTIPSIKVLSPNGGETWIFGNTYEIKWKAENTRSTVGIGLTRPTNNTDGTSGYSICNIGVATASLGRYPLKLIENMTCPYGIENLKPSQYYKAIVYEQGQAGLSVLSDDYFTITSPTDDGCINGENYSRTTGKLCNINNPVISGVSGPQSLTVGQTGTWTVSAYDNSNPGSSGNLTYSVNWGDQGIYGASVAQLRTQTQQTATFSHTYSNLGTYYPTFTVTNSSGKTAKTSLSVKVEQRLACPQVLVNCVAGTSPESYIGTDGCTSFRCVPDIIKIPFITILSPNGGETFAQGSSVKISWKLAGLTSANNSVSISVYVARADNNYFRTAAPVFGVTWYNDMSGSTVLDTGSYNWNIPSTFSPGQYVILIGSSLMYTDTSDAPFSIISSSTPGGAPTGSGTGTGTTTRNGVVSFVPESSLTVEISGPTISSVSGPQTLNVNQTGTWKVKASDSSGGNLSYSVVWGDEVYATTRSSQSTASQSPQQSATFTHSYSTAGTYTPIFTVTNNSEQSAKTSLSVKVGNTTTPSITVLSPNSGQTYQPGNTMYISWNGGYGTDHIVIDLLQVSGNSYLPVSGSSRVAINNVGSYSLTIPSVVPTGSNYIIGVGILNTSSGVMSAYGYSGMFTITSSTVPTNPPTISSVSGPQSLNVNQQGTWMVNASDPNVNPGSSNTLTYSVNWGDFGVVCPSGISCATTPSTPFQQSATFTHSYSTAGIYYPTFTVKNTNGQSVKTSLNVNIIGTTSILRSLPANALGALDNITNSDKQNSQTNSVTNTSSSCGEFTMLLAKGMNNSQVKCLQQLLSEKGFKVEGIELGKETTLFGYNTLMALKKFQASNNLTADGIFGPASREALVK